MTATHTLRSLEVDRSGAGCVLSRLSLVLLAGWTSRLFVAEVCRPRWITGLRRPGVGAPLLEQCS